MSVIVGGSRCRAVLRTAAKRRSDILPEAERIGQSLLTSRPTSGRGFFPFPRRTAFDSVFQGEGNQSQPFPSREAVPCMTRLWPTKRDGLGGENTISPCSASGCCHSCLPPDYCYRLSDTSRINVTASSEASNK